MTELKKTLDAKVYQYYIKGHAILEMPTGTGKTISLLALILSYLARYPERIKKVFVSTHTYKVGLLYTYCCGNGKNIKRDKNAC